MLNIRKCWESKFLVSTLVLVVLVCGLVVKLKLVSKNCLPIKRGNGKEVLPILMVGCAGAFVGRTLRSLTYFRQNSTGFPIIVYNDRGTDEINKVVKNMADWDPTISLVQNPEPNESRNLLFALKHMFITLQHEAVIVLDDNLDISPDFFEYFLASYRLLEKDHTIWCVSAWNDNGKKTLIDITKPDLMHRTDFFPGNGWMIRYETWKEIEPFLSGSFNAESLNDPAFSRGRVCIRPEISRTFNFGVCNATDIEMENRHPHDEPRILYTGLVQFTHYDLSYLLQNNEPSFFSFVYSCAKVTAAKVMSGTLDNSLKCVRIPYSDVEMFRKTAKFFGLMNDFQHGVTRTALHGIVQFQVKGLRVFLTPENNNFTHETDF